MKAITKYLGNFGKYQAYVYALLFVPCAISGAQTLIFSFTGAIPNARCRTVHDDVDGYDYQMGINATNVINAGAKNDGSMVQYCEYCLHANCTPKPCDNGYVYDTSQYHTSLTMKFDLICDGSWKREMAKSLYMGGVLVGAGLFGTLADRFGRKPIFVVSALIQLVTFNVIYFVNTYALFCALQFINGAVQYGTYLTGFTLVMELLGGLPRTICGIWVQGYFAIGYIYVGIMAYFIRDWKWLQFSVSVICLLYIPYFWLLPESIRWLTVKGRTNEAKAVFLNAAKWNNVEVDEKTLDAELKPDVVGGDQSTVLQLFTHWNLARTTLIVFFSWFVVSMVYYGLSLNTSDLPGSAYTNFILSGLVELPGYVFCIPMMEYWGRKPSLVICFAVSGISCIASGFIPHDYGTVVVITAVTGKMFASAAFAVIYNYSAEVYPTVVRNGGTGLSSLFARVGSLSAPQIHLLHSYVAEWLPIVIYGSFSLCAALVDTRLPETRNRDLPETIDDGIHFNQFSKRKKSMVMSNLGSGAVAGFDNNADELPVQNNTHHNHTTVNRY